MKKIIFVAMVLVCAFATSFAQSKTPTVIIKAFNQKYPNAKKISWGKENATEWEAEFTLDGSKLSANFTVNGAWVETERKIPVSQFPKPVADAIQKQYPNWKITEADKTETAKHGTIYEADIKSGTKKKALAFKEDGTTVIE